MRKVGEKVVLHSSGEAVLIKGVIDTDNYLVVDGEGNYKPINKSQIKVGSGSMNFHDEKLNISADRNSAYIKIKDKKGEDELALAFEYGSQDTVDGFFPYLMNKSGSPCEVKIHVGYGTESYLDENFSLPAYQARKLVFLPTTVFSVTLTVQIDLTQFYTDGSSENYFLKNRLKAKFMQADPKYDTAIERRVIKRIFTLSEKEDGVKELKKYTESLKRRSQDTGYKRLVDIHDPRIRAQFSGEIDLHLKALVDNPEEYSNSEALGYQLKCLREYIDQAYQLGLSSITVIHGIGTGKLSRKIREQCEKDSRIRGCGIGRRKGSNIGTMEIFFQ